jgi:Zn-dependent peptidase ImmA (M78 family)
VSAFVIIVITGAFAIIHYERASELLISDDDFFGALDDGQSFSQAASSLNVPAEFLDFKARLMKEKGYELGDSPITANSKFLKSMTVPDYYEYGC